MTRPKIFVAGSIGPLTKKQAMYKERLEAQATRLGFSCMTDFYAYRRIKYKDRQKASHKKWSANNRESARASALNASARQRGAVVTLSTADLADWLSSHMSDLCSYCGKKSNEVDHKIPLSKGGLHVLDNLQRVCKYCNLAKLDKTHEEFLLWIKDTYEYLLNGR